MQKVVEIKNLNFVYPDGKKALYDIDMAIYKGESVGIIGPNGAGKTTLLLHLNGVLRGKGTVKVLGMEVNDGNLRQIRSKVGLVFQDPDDQLFCPTVFDDVAFGPLNLRLPEDVVRSRVKEALQEVGLSGFERRSPHHLSFGEKKRISLATVLSMHPEVLVLDEPTSNLDPRARREQINLLKEIRITKIIAGHDLEMIFGLCGRIIILCGGRIVADGQTKEIIGDRELLEANGLEVPFRRD